MTDWLYSRREALYCILEGDGSGHKRLSRLLRRLIVALIVLNGLAVVLESNAEIRAAYFSVFAAFELFSVGVFTLEYLCRIWVSAEDPRYSGVPAWKARCLHAVSPLALVDLLAIAPFYLSLLVPIDLRYLRFFRLFRLLKLSHYFDGLHIFTAVLRREASSIAAALLTILILIIVSACLMFTVENAAHPGRFTSINDAIWWAVVTLTTVGYGDVTPISFGGKLLGMVIMLLGIGTMALPAGILAARFSEELHSRREYLRQHVLQALVDGEIDDDEQRAIESLTRELGLSRDIAERLVAGSRQRAATSTCPRCGERLVPASPVASENHSAARP